MRQTIKDVVLQMIPDIPQQQYQMQPPSFQDAFLSQQLLPAASFPSQNALQTQTQPHPTQFTNIYNSSLPPQLNIHQQSSTTNIPSSSYQSFIPSQSFTLNKSTPPHQLYPPLENQITNPSESQPSESQSSKIDSDL